MRTKKIIHKFGFLYRPIKKVIFNYLESKHIKKETKKIDILLNTPCSIRKIFYLGITSHSNLGDMAQYYCINKWIKENYPDYELVMFESNTVVDRRYNFISRFKDLYHKDDIIVFQSGYTTQDLGGNHDLMHRLICENLPYAHILMMPQTILFKNDANRIRTSNSYNLAKSMLFLARDKVSFEQAQKMFPDITVQLFPDIVTSLIGKRQYNNIRKGVCFCIRDDSEKFYSDKEILTLKHKLDTLTVTTLTDTTINVSFKKIRNNIEKYIFEAIESFSKFEVTITDRYHGTIFSLIAGTPVIIIKSNDHKVTTGAEWFKGVYDDYVYVAKDLDDAFNIYISLMQKKLSHQLSPYFETNYYSKLKDNFQKIER